MQHQNQLKQAVYPSVGIYICQMPCFCHTHISSVFWVHQSSIRCSCCKGRAEEQLHTSGMGRLTQPFADPQHAAVTARHQETQIALPNSLLFYAACECAGHQEAAG